jgi:transposase
MSGPGGEEQRFVVVADARRRWTRAEKEAIVAESAGGASVSAVARSHNIAASLLFRWRRQFAAKTPPVCTAPAFVPVALPPPVEESAAASPLRRAGNASVIEIELVGGRRLRVDASVDVKALRRVIEALEQR